MAKKSRRDKFIRCLAHFKNEYDFVFDVNTFTIAYKTKKADCFTPLDQRAFNNLWCDLIMVWEIEIAQKDLQRAIDLISQPLFHEV